MLGYLLASLTIASAPSAQLDTTIQRGIRIPASRPVALSAVLENPAAYTSRAVVIEGVVVRSCTAMGCWMQVAPNADAKGLNVRFKDESFYIPLNSAGMAARAVGIAVITPRTAEEATKAEAEGRFVRRAITGTGMIEVGFEATGVELRGSGVPKDGGAHTNH